MILVDTSVWVTFLNKGDDELAKLLESGKVFTHESVIGELACGNIKNRNNILTLLNELPKIPTATFSEVLYIIEKHKLFGAGLGYIDCHLLASALIANITLWTNDKSLRHAARLFEISYR